MFALIDCNNFYASCERVFAPNLNGKPIVVLSNNDGCAIARSNEAKAIGIPMGAPAFEFKDLFVNHKVHVFSANFSLYGNMSNRIMSILSEYSPEVEIYSIDEAFLKLKGFECFNLLDYAYSIRKRVTQGTGIPVSIGIAPTKSLSKVANRIAKKYTQTGGVFLIDTEEKRIKALKWLAIEDVWGIGRKYATRLRAQGVNTAYDFTQLSDAWVKKEFSIVGLRLKRDLSGIPALDLDDVQAKKNIATTRSFEKNITKIEDLKERIATFAVSCSEKLRKQKSYCKMLMVFIHTNGFRKDLPQYSRSRVIKLPFPSNSSIELVEFACIALESIFIAGYSYKKAGVLIMDFIPENQIQLNLFQNSNPKHEGLMKVIDKLNNRFGQQKVRLSIQDQKRVWKMKQEKLSPLYTTRIEDVITIQV